MPHPGRAGLTPAEIQAPGLCLVSLPSLFERNRIHLSLSGLSQTLWISQADARCLNRVMPGVPACWLSVWPSQEEDRSHLNSQKSPSWGRQLLLSVQLSNGLTVPQLFQKPGIYTEVSVSRQRLRATLCPELRVPSSLMFTPASSYLSPLCRSHFGGGVNSFCHVRLRRSIRSASGRTSQPCSEHGGTLPKAV